MNAVACYDYVHLILSPTITVLAAVATTITINLPSLVLSVYHWRDDDVDDEGSFDDGADDSDGDAQFCRTGAAAINAATGMTIF